MTAPVDKEDFAQDPVCGDNADLCQAAVHRDGPCVAHDKDIAGLHVVGELQIALADGLLREIGLVQRLLVNEDAAVIFVDW